MSKQKTTRTINVSGTIVGADWDAFLTIFPQFASAYTCEAAFIRELQAAADAGEDVLVRVNSWGGEVFAERNMLDAFQQFTGGKRVHVAGMAMSAASDFVLKSGVLATASEGAVLMFHSATSFTWGGPDAMRDAADLLDQINESSRKALLAHGVPEERVRAAFAEGRMLTMLAAEAAKFGIVGKITGAREANPAKPDPDMLKKAGPDALGKLPKQAADRLARLCQLADGNEVDDPATAEAAPAADGGGVEDPATDAEPEAEAGADPAPAPAESAEPEPSSEPAADAAADARVSPAPAAPPAHADGAAPSSDPAPATAPAPAEQAGAPERLAELEKQVRAVQSASGKKIHELTASLEAARAETAAALSQRDDAIRERDAAQAKLAEFDTKLAQLTAALAAERTARADLVADVLAPESDQEIPAGATPHADRLAALRSLDERVAYAKAHAAELAAERARR